MKPYLFAPIVIAGLVTAGGTATIVSAEFQAVRTGQQVASLFQARKNSIMTVDESRPNLEMVARLDKAREDSRLGGLASMTTPVPDVDIKVDPVSKCEEDQAKCEAEQAKCEAKERACEARIARRAVRVPRPARAAEAPVTLATNYSLQSLPTPGTVSKVFVPGSDGKTFIALSNLPKAQGANFRFVFDSKKWEKDQKSLLKQLNALKVNAWAMDGKDLEKMKSFQISWSDKDGKVVTMNPLEAAAAAQKASVDMAKSSNDRDFDPEDSKDDIIATPNR